MRNPFRIIVFVVILASCAGTSSSLADQIEESHFSSKASFAREGYEVHFPVSNRDGKQVLEISCYSLDDESREKFASRKGTDPVSDLSCYVKDFSRENEYTMLGIYGESLQFTPAFFWFSEVKKCAPHSYFLKSSLRGILISFELYNIDEENKSANLNIDIIPMASATNDNLTDDTFKTICN
ncbi:hypothetical protein [Sphingopyxis sp. DBS4]|uniref:hypothetical protein n=1 Tax=Sphingopyxis sp. DBS4 TaxID=2968500 RepID=UPI00214BEA5F|nr:hypothetical protein [Sphingopyxis sp. DBS4]